MGTSTSISTPSGGGWGRAKREITAHLADPQSVPSARVVSGVISAMGGLGLGITGGRGGRGDGRGAGGGGGRTGGGHARKVGRAVARLGGFASAVQERGLADALRGLDLGELDGRPAVEVVARVSEQLASGLDGVDGEILRKALNDAILETAALENELGFTDLEAGLQTFLDEEGLGGLIEMFLTRLASDLVAAAILDHVGEKTDSDPQTEALLAGIEIVCREKTRAMVNRNRNEGRFNRVNWFGPAGTRLGRELADSIVAELRTGLSAP